MSEAAGAPGPPGAEGTAPPWHRRDDWRESVARSDTGTRVRDAWIVAVIWTALAAPLAWVVFPEQWARGTIWAWLLVAFFLVGVWLLVEAARTTLEWRRFGTPTVELDPLPGSPGGHVGGAVTLPVRGYRRPDFRVTLSCVHRQARSTGGSGGSTWESVVWSRVGIPRVELASGGTRLRFTFSVPEDLPATEEPSASYHCWLVRVTGRVSGVDPDSAFEVPVFASDPPRTAENPAPVEEPEHPFRDFPPSLVRIEPARRGGVRLRFPAGRERTGGAMMLVAGLVFGGMPLGFWLHLVRSTGTEGELAVVVLAAGGLVLGVFFLLGLFLLGLGAFTLLNTLDVTLSGDELVSVRRFLGIPRRRTMRVDEAEHVELSISGQVGQGAHARPYYELRAFPRDGGRIFLADGIPGPVLAERLARLVEEETGLEVRRVPRGERSSPVARRKETRRAGEG